jgi:hypothetical protein
MVPGKTPKCKGSNRVEGLAFSARVLETRKLINKLTRQNGRFSARNVNLESSLLENFLPSEPEPSILQSELQFLSCLSIKKIVSARCRSAHHIQNGHAA